MCFVFSIVQVVENTMADSPEMGKCPTPSHLPDPRVQEPIEERYPEIRIETEKPKGVMGVDQIFFCKKKT